MGPIHSSHASAPGAAPGCTHSVGESPMPGGFLPGNGRVEGRLSPMGWWGVHQDFLPGFLKPVWRDLSSFRAAEERSNSHILRFH